MDCAHSGLAVQHAGHGQRAIYRPQLIVKIIEQEKEESHGATH